MSPLRRMPPAAAALLVAATASAFPAAAADGPGNAAYQFLRLGSGARIEALGGAGTALADGTDALVWNPARIGRGGGPEFGGAYSNWLDDTQIGHLGAVWPLGASTVGLSVKSLSVGDFGNVPGETEIGQSDLAVGAAAAYALPGGLIAGLGAKVVRSSLADIDATGWAADAGLDYEWVEGWHLSAALRNFGPAFGYVDGVEETLPTQAAVALGSTFGELRVGSEVLWEEGPGWVGVIGAEYRPWDRLAVRLGSRIGEDGNAAREPWAAGIGVEARPGWNLEYAFRDGVFAPSHRVGIRWSPQGPEPARSRLARSPREFYLDVVNEALERSLVTFPSDAGDSVIVRGKRADPADAVLSEAIAAKLRARGLAVQVMEPAVAAPENLDQLDDAAKAALAEQGIGVKPDLPLLEYEILVSRYEILRAHRARWVGPRSFDREAEVDLDLTLTVPESGTPRWTSSAQAAASEFVAASRVPDSAGYPRPAGTAPAARKKSPFVEPAIVGGLVAGLAVIFFSNRDVGN